MQTFFDTPLSSVLSRDYLTPKATGPYKSYTLRNFREIPQIRRLSPDQVAAIEVVGRVLPFKTNNYVVNELIDWRNVPDDPMFVLNFPQKDMLLPEHYDLINSIMEGKPINDGFRMANSTMVGILGMIASFTGKRESYKELFESRFKIEPNVDNPSFDMPVASPDANGLYKIPVPGVYQRKTERF